MEIGHELLTLRSLSPLQSSGTSRITRALLLLSAPIRRQEMGMPVLRVYADQEASMEEESRDCQRRVHAWRR